MRRVRAAGWFGLIATIGGCAGLGTGFTGQISGVVFDVNGDVVRGARVFAEGRETLTNSSGIYVLDRVGDGEVTIRASVTRNGATFTGVNVFRVFRDERTKNANIVVVRTNQQARLFGVVRDRFGNLVQGARVFAVANALTSNVDITDSSGGYSLEGLASGMAYAVTASARTYDSDTTSVTLSPGESRLVNFVLDDETNPTLPAPQNLSAVAWTTPFEPTRDPFSEATLRERQAYEAIKRFLDPRRAAHPPGRDTPVGNHVEVDLYWDPLPNQYTNSLLGFGIYRATTASGAATAIDFLRDPYAIFFADIDRSLLVGRVYYYEVTALNTSYPDFANSESAPSNRYGVLTLGDLFLLDVTAFPLTFHWQAAQNAEWYSVYLFDEFPSIGVVPIWSTESSPTMNTSQPYTGPALQAGRRYYYIVLGFANDGDSRTLSRIGEFVAN